MKHYLTLQAFDEGAYLTGTIAFFELCLHSFSKTLLFGSRFCFHLQVMKNVSRWTLYSEQF